MTGRSRPRSAKLTLRVEELEGRLEEAEKKLAPTPGGRRNAHSEASRSFQEPIGDLPSRQL